MIALRRFLLAAFATATLLPMAEASVVSVSIYGFTEDLGDGTYEFNGSFEWASYVPGASSDPTNVPFTDPGIRLVNIVLSWQGTPPELVSRFNGNDNIAGGYIGAMDLSKAGQITVLTNSPICLEADDENGNGTCLANNPAGLFYIPPPGVFLQVSAPGVETFVEASEWTIDVRIADDVDPAPVPLPATLPILGSALVLLAGRIYRRAFKKAAVAVPQF